VQPSVASLVFLVIPLVLLPILSLRTHRSGQLSELPRPAIYLSAALSQWSVVGLLAVVLWVTGDGTDGLGLAAPTRGPSTALWLLIILAAAAALTGLLRLIRRRTGSTESADVRHLLPRTRRERLLFCLVVIPTAGIAEEILFRGLAISRLAHLLNGAVWPAALLAALAFALGHLYQDGVGVARAGLLGLVLSLPYVVSGSILPSILAHMIYDLLGGVVFPDLLLGPETDDLRHES